MTTNDLPFHVFLAQAKKQLYASISHDSVQAFSGSFHDLIKKLLPCGHEGYWYLIPHITSLLETLPGKNFEERVLLLKALMCELTEYQMHNNYYLTHSKALMHQAQKRFTLLLEKNLAYDANHYKALDDVFFKEFAYCTGKLISTGLLAFDITKLPKTLLLKNISLWPYFIKIRAFNTFIEAHLDKRYHASFSLEGWVHSYLLATEILRLSPEIRGIFGRCWFYDPFLAHKISPNLRFASAFQLENGAKLLATKTLQVDIELATNTSRTRKELYDKGLYTPRGYSIIWDRQSLLAWRKAQKGEGDLHEES